MFLKKLYRYNKLLALMVAGFLLGYIYVNYKWGMTATPVQQYGMFSGKYFIKDSLLLYTVKANDKIINSAALSLIERDLVQSYPDYFEKQQHTNEAIFNTVNIYFNYLGISAAKNKYKFINNTSDAVFSNWYRSKMEDIINEPIRSLEVYKQNVVWDNKKLQLIDTPVKIIFIAAN